jgi:hypothetical protein
MERFKYVFKYIDAICWINIDDVHQFLNHVAFRYEDNPFLDLSSLGCGIKSKSDLFLKDRMLGIKAHFMNFVIKIEDKLKDFILRNTTRGYLFHFLLQNLSNSILTWI